MGELIIERKKINIRKILKTLVKSVNQENMKPKSFILTQPFVKYKVIKLNVCERCYGNTCSIENRNNFILHELDTRIKAILASYFLLVKFRSDLYFM